MNLQPMDKREFLDLCGPYALGALDGGDLARFRAALPAADAEMRAALEDAMRLAEQLSLAAPEASPSPDVKARLMRRIAATDSAPVPRRELKVRRASVLDRLLGAWLTPRPALAFGFSLFVLSVGLVAYSVSLRGTVEAQRADLGDREGRIASLTDSLAVADSLRARIVMLRDSLAQKEAMLAVLNARSLQMVAMGGMEGTKESYGKVLWDPETKTAVLQVSLPPEPDGMAYQLWVIRGNKPMDAGVFHVSAGSPGMYRIENLAETDRKHIHAFAVTVEPKGGMPQPTGSMVLMGKMEI